MLKLKKIIMVEAFLTIRFLDILDIFLVAFIMYQIYLLIKGTVAMQIFIGIILIILFWWIVTALKMELLGSILGKLISVGVIAIIILFQQELRRFLLLLGTQYFPNRTFSLDQLLPSGLQNAPSVKVRSILKACLNMSQNQVGALIVIKRKSSLDIYAQTGDILNANTSSRLLESIFSKNSPLHDGAVIIIHDKIYAARSVLPVSENVHLPANYGLRHRAAVGLTENTDALVVIVSEETGQISVAESGRLISNLDSRKLLQILEREFSNQR